MSNGFFGSRCHHGTTRVARIVQQSDSVKPSRKCIRRTIEVGAPFHKFDLAPHDFLALRDRRSAIFAVHLDPFFDARTHSGSGHEDCNLAGVINLDKTLTGERWLVGTKRQYPCPCQILKLNIWVKAKEGGLLVAGYHDTWFVWRSAVEPQRVAGRSGPSIHNRPPVATVLSCVSGLGNVSKPNEELACCHRWKAVDQDLNVRVAETLGLHEVTQQGQELPTADRASSTWPVLDKNVTTRRLPPIGLVWVEVDLVGIVTGEHNMDAITEVQQLCLILRTSTRCNSRHRAGLRTVRVVFVRAEARCLAVTSIATIERLTAADLIDADQQSTLPRDIPRRKPRELPSRVPLVVLSAVR